MEEACINGMEEKGDVETSPVLILKHTNEKLFREGWSDKHNPSL